MLTSRAAVNATRRCFSYSTIPCQASSSESSFLDRRAANHAPLTPLSFIERTAAVFPDKPAIVYHNWQDGIPECEPDFQQTWGQTFRRCKQVASALSQHGVSTGDVVGVLTPNTPCFVELHHAVNMAGATINPINTRLDASTLAYVLAHSGAKVLLVDTGLTVTVRAAIEEMKANGAVPPMVVDLEDPLPEIASQGVRLGNITYEQLVEGGDPDFKWLLPDDEWDTQALSYTSGTTGRPKGVLYHHRGMALNAINNSLVWGMQQHPRYLWTLPMFHCSGWCFPYTVTLQAGVHVCLRSVDPKSIFSAMESQQVTHLCGAPVVMNMLVHAPNPLLAQWREALLSSNIEPKMFTAGAPPPAAVIELMEDLGFDVTHVYGLTEVYGPVTSSPANVLDSSLETQEKAERKARQGVRYPLLENVAVVKIADGGEEDSCAALSNAPVPDDWMHVPRDGATIGEIMMRGNVVMKGYLDDPAATEEAFEGGWFHTGDLAVVHADGYIEVKDRKKDIIISGGENISTVEVENVLFRHPAVLEASVVAKPDVKWGETPCAFVVLKAGCEWGGEATDAGGDKTTEQNIIEYCRAHLPHFKAPKNVVYLQEGLPKTSTGKVQKYELRELASDLK